MALIRSHPTFLCPIDLQYSAAPHYALSASGKMDSVAAAIEAKKQRIGKDRPQTLAQAQ